MTIRPARSGDAAALSILEADLFTAANYPLSRASFYYHIRHNLLFVAETEQGEIAGYALALIRRRKAKLYSLGTAPHYRGQGVGGALLESMIKELNERGFKEVVLEVRCDNTGAVTLYERYGFIIVNRLDAFYRDGCDAYLMERTNA